MTRRALEIINPDKKLPLHVSLDIDVLDPSEAPATGTRGNIFVVLTIIVTHRAKEDIFVQKVKMNIYTILPSTYLPYIFADSRFFQMVC